MHTSIAMKLPAGTYTVYWKLWLTGFKLQLASGTLTVLAVPCSMGGALRLAGAEPALKEEPIITTRDPAQPDVFVTIDRSGAPPDLLSGQDPSSAWSGSCPLLFSSN